MSTDETPIDKLMADIDEKPILGEAAEEIGRNLLNAMISELTAFPHPSIANQSAWSSMKEAKQDEIIERFTRRIRDEVSRGVQQIMADGNPAVAAKLSQVVVKGDNIKGTIEINHASGHVSTIADFAYAGNHVAVIMPESLEKYFENMGEDVSSTPDQQSLPLSDDSDDVAGNTDGSGDASRIQNEPDGIPSELLDDDPGNTSEPVDDQGDPDPAQMSVSDLVKACAEAAAAIGENSLTEEVFAEYGRDQLVDYLTWAREKKHSSDDNNGE